MGTHSALGERSHTAAHTAKHGAFRMGALLLPSERSTRFGNPAWPGFKTANFAAFGSWSETLLKNAESLRDSDALLMRVAVPRRRGPAGLRYYRVADMQRTLMSWDEWLWRRFRMYIWKQWKTPKTKVANLRKLGTPADKAYHGGNSRLGYWHIAGSPVLKCFITNERLAAAGYFSILSYYESLHLCG